jgi:hypothetical protein
MSWFQTARDWTAFVLSLTSLTTAGLALRNSLVGPQPVLGEMAGETVTILPSSEFRTGSPPKAALPLLDENRHPTDFPVLLVQPSLGNRAPPPNGIAVRSINATFTVRRGGPQNGSETILRADYLWFRLVESNATPTDDQKWIAIVFSSTKQVAPFDLPGGTTWSQEVLFVPRQTLSEQSWKSFLEKLDRKCQTESVPCVGEVAIEVRFADEQSLRTDCKFSVGATQLAFWKGERHRYFAVPECLENIRSDRRSSNRFDEWVFGLLGVR